MRRLLSPVKGPGIFLGISFVTISFQASHNASVDENYYRIRETFASERLFEEVSVSFHLFITTILIS